MPVVAGEALKLACPCLWIVRRRAPARGLGARLAGCGLRLVVWCSTGRGTRRSDRLLEKQGVGVGGGPLLHKALYPLLGPHPDKIFVEISKFQTVC